MMMPAFWDTNTAGMSTSGCPAGFDMMISDCISGRFKYWACMKVHQRQIQMLGLEQTCAAICGSRFVTTSKQRGS